MSEHMNQWLGAYHDGELRGKQLRMVEEHLAGCAACKAELDEIQSLSALLHETIEEDAFIPTDRFVANLILTMPRRGDARQAGPAQTRQFAWWFVPVSLLLVMTFVEITMGLSLAASIAADTGLLTAVLPVAESSQAQMSWFAGVMNVFGEQLGAPGQALLSILNEANLVFAQLVRSLLPQALLAIAYIGWLFAWWLKNQENHSITARS